MVLSAAFPVFSRESVGHTTDPHSYHFMPTKPDLSATHAALADARRVREEFRSRPAGDPERRESVTAALDVLRDAWGAEHEAYMRSGSRVARSISTDPVHVAQRERRAQMKALRSMLAPAAGTHPPAERWTARQMRGKLRQSHGALRGLADEYVAMRSVLGRGSIASRRGGGFYTSMSGLNDEASRMLEDLREERRSLRTAWQRFERTPVTTYRQRDEFDRLAAQLAALREFADLLGAELAAAARQRTPDARPARTTWTATAIREALDRFEHERGRLPTKRELNTDPSLPHYTTCVRKLGPSPLSKGVRSSR